jgi:biopolymer transport protein ExbD
MGAKTAARVRAAMEPAKEPNVIPFIDVLLVLPIIFMVTAPKPTTDLRLEMQQSGPRRTVMIPPTVVQLREAPDGYRLFVGAEETTIQEVSELTLLHMLAVDRAITPEDAYTQGRVYVRSDLDVAYQHVVAVVDELQQAQFQKVTIASQSADAG